MNEKSSLENGWRFFYEPKKERGKVVAEIRQTGSDGVVEGGGVEGMVREGRLWREVRQALPDGAV